MCKQNIVEEDLPLENAENDGEPDVNCFIFFSFNKQFFMSIRLIYLGCGGEY